jgi:diguanylate cyclase (GGDEF)-like protein
MSLLFMDLDGFKQVNDGFGHEIGDRLLIAFSERTRTCVRRTDTMGRLAGDEFFVILEDLHDPDCNPADIAAKIVDAAAEPFNCSGNLVKIGVSIGVVVYDGQGTAPTGNELLIRADRQMYLAKRSGKNRYVIEAPAQVAGLMRTP